MNRNRLSDSVKIVGCCHFSGSLAKMPQKMAKLTKVAEEKGHSVEA
jgi:hypothetical protein